MADRVELIIHLSGDKTAYQSLLNLQRAVDSLKHTKVDLRIDQTQLRREIMETIADLKDLKRALGEDYKEAPEYKEAADRLRDLKSAYDEVTQKIREYGAAIAAGRQDSQDWEASLRSQADAVRTLGEALAAIGDVSQWTHDFAVGIGNAFTSMGDLFSSNIFDWAGRKLTYMATENIIGDFSRIVSRYDIMSTFTRYLGLMGVTADDAASALQRVNDSILGLPIGLDESAQRLRRYQMYLGDLDAATNLTIGLQNAIFAGGASEQMRTTTLYQIDRLLAVGKLNTTRQWNALLQGLGVSVRYIAEELGYAIDDVSDFASMVSSGAISTDQFLSALMRLGEGTSAASQKLTAALDIYKSTIESWLSNIQFAAVRGGETVLKSLEMMLQDATGQGIVGYLRDTRDAMNDLYKGVGTWIMSNPQSFTKNIDALENLMSAIQRFSASNVAVMIFDNLARGINLLANEMNRLPKEDVEEFFAFATTLAGPLGAVFSAASSGAAGLIGVFQRFRDFDFEGLIRKIITQIDRLASAIEFLLGLIPDGMMGDLLAFGLVWGKPIADVLGTVSAGVLTLATNLSVLTATSPAAAAALTNLAGSLATIAPLIGVAGVAAGITAVNIATPRWEHEEVLKKVRDQYGFTAEDDTRVEQSAENLEEYNKQLEKLKKSLADATPEEVEKIKQAIVDLSEAEKAAAEAAIEENSKLIQSYLDRQTAIEDEIASLMSEDIDPDTDPSGTYKRAEAIRKLNDEYKQNALLIANAQASNQTEVERYNAAKATAEEYATAVQNLATRVSDSTYTQEERLSDLTTVWTTLREGADKTIAKQVAGFEALEKAEEISIGKLTDNLQSQVDALTEYGENLGNLEANIAALGEVSPEYAETLARIVGEATSQGLDGAGIVAGLNKALQTAIDNEDFTAVDNLVNVFNEKLLAQESATDMTAFAETFAQNFYTTLETAFGNLENFGSVQDLIFGEGGIESILEPIGELSASLSKDNGAAAGVLDLDKSVKAFTGETAPELQQQLEEIYEDVTTLTSDGIIPLYQAEDTATESTNKLREAIERLVNTMNSKRSSISAFAGMFTTLKSQVDVATSAIRGLQAAINELQSKTVTVTVNTSGGGGGDTTPHTGGLIGDDGGVRYYAKGGMVFPRPRGTDIIPAMLSPGEYVLRRNAVDRLGVPFLQRLNRLDIAGAIDSMMHRFYRPTAAAYSVVNNRTDNRSYAVTVNNSNASEGFTYWTASRAVHAL